MTDDTDRDEMPYHSLTRRDYLRIVLHLLLAMVVPSAVWAVIIIIARRLL